MKELNQSKNKITLGHDFEYHEVNYLRRLHIASLQYSRKTPFGSVVLSGNIADLHKSGEAFLSKEIGKQIEIDLYPKITKWNYLYLSYGYSNSVLFPLHRVGFEIYQKLPKSFELSAGFRFLQFESTTLTNTDTLKNIMIFTGSLGKYYKNFWFSFRPFLNP